MATYGTFFTPLPSEFTSLRNIAGSNSTELDALAKQVETSEEDYLEMQDPEARKKAGSGKRGSTVKESIPKNYKEDSTAMRSTRELTVDSSNYLGSQKELKSICNNAKENWKNTGYDIKMDGRDNVGFSYPAYMLIKGWCKAPPAMCTLDDKTPLNRLPKSILKKEEKKRLAISNWYSCARCVAEQVRINPKAFSFGIYEDQHRAKTKSKSYSNDSHTNAVKRLLESKNPEALACQQRNKPPPGSEPVITISEDLPPPSLAEEYVKVYKTDWAGSGGLVAGGMVGAMLLMKLLKK